MSLAPEQFLNKKMTLNQESLVNLFEIWLDALTYFMNKNTQKFDPLVGENACHIRAIYLLDLISTQKTHVKLVHQIQITIQDLHVAIDKLKNISFNKEHSGKSIYDFLCHYKIFLHVAKDYVYPLKFIINSYILTLTKESRLSDELTLIEITNFHPLREKGFPKNKAKLLVSHTQKELSYMSCQYVLNLLNIHNDEYLRILLKIRKDSHGRYCLAQFYAAKILIKKILQDQHNLVIKINRFIKKKYFDTITHVYKPNYEKSDFQIISKPTCEFCLVAEGFVNYQNKVETQEEYNSRLLSCSLKQILLETFALHPQYSGDIKNDPPPFIDALNYLSHQQHIAVHYYQILDLEHIKNQIHNEKLDFENTNHSGYKRGCSLNNPSLLVLSHIYWDKITN